MTRRAAYRLVLMLLGIAVCLTIPACRTSEQKVSDSDELSTSSDAACEVTKRLKRITIPEMTFRPPATIVDAIDFFKQASIDYDDPSVPLDKRGVGLILRLNQDPSPVANEATEPTDVFSAAATASRDLPKIAAMSVRFISLYDALELVCEATDMKWCVSEGGHVLITSRDGGGDCVMGSYTIPQSFLIHLRYNSYQDVMNDDPNKPWNALFTQLGVMGPAFARVEYQGASNKLLVTNTPKNLSIIEGFLDQFALRMVEVELQIHAFRTSDIESLRLAGGMSLESLMTLRQNGKAKPVARATVLTKSGQEAIMKTVKELVFPTELLADVPLTNSNLAVRAEAKTVMPASFATREIGMILQVAPEISINQAWINLTLRPEWSTLEGWESYPAYMGSGWMYTSPSFKQPLVGVTSFGTQVLVKDGGTVLLGSCSTPEGEWVNVGFLTTRLKNAHPPLSSSCSDKPKPRDERKDAEVKKKMRETIIPEMTFRPPATIIDAVDFFKQASIDYEKSAAPEAQRGINMVLKLTPNCYGSVESNTNADVFAATNAEDSVPAIPAITARFLTLHDALKLVCDVTGMRFKIKDGIVWIVPLNEPSEGMITRLYLDQLQMRERMVGVDENIDQTRKMFFSQMGVSWPMGSSLAWVEAISAIRVTNTPENMTVFEQVLEDLSGASRMIEVDLQIYAFPAEEIEKMSLWGNMSIEALMALRRKGKSSQVASATLLTKSGQEGTVKAVREVLYPTELLTDFDQSGSNVTVQTAAQTLVPGSFVMRETGMSLQVVPEMSDADQSEINVTLKPTWVTLDHWETYPADRAAGWTCNKIPFKQPVFGVTSFETQTRVKDGGTVLLGSTSTLDGKWVHVGFLTVKRKLISGEPTKDAKK